MSCRYARPERPRRRWTNSPPESFRSSIVHTVFPVILSSVTMPAPGPPGDTMTCGPSTSGESLMSHRSCGRRNRAGCCASRPRSHRFSGRPGRRFRKARRLDRRQLSVCRAGPVRDRWSRGSPSAFDQTSFPSAAIQGNDHAAAAAHALEEHAVACNRHRPEAGSESVRRPHHAAVRPRAILSAGRFPSIPGHDRVPATAASQRRHAAAAAPRNTVAANVSVLVMGISISRVLAAAAPLLPRRQRSHVVDDAPDVVVWNARRRTPSSSSAGSPLLITL